MLAVFAWFLPSILTTLAPMAIFGLKKGVSAVIKNADQHKDDPTLNPNDIKTRGKTISWSEFAFGSPPRPSNVNSPWMSLDEMKQEGDYAYENPQQNPPLPRGSRVKPPSDPYPYGGGGQTKGVKGKKGTKRTNRTRGKKSKKGKKGTNGKKSKKGKKGKKKQNKTRKR
jgi:hypothetical protein